jgi:hypothetical protein
VAEDAGLAAVVDEQRREQPDQRRLARAVLAEDRDALAALDRERDVVQRDAADSLSFAGHVARNRE